MKATNKLMGLAAVSGLLCAMHTLPAQASLITVTGTHVDFSYDSALLGLFGTPTVAGDNLFFSPTAFTASAANCAGLTTATATTYIDVLAHAGYSFDGMTLTEQGDYKLRGTSGFAAASGELLAIDKNNPPAGGPSASAFLDTSDDTTVSDGKLHAWSATAQLDLSGSAWANTDSVRVTLENLLEAYAAPGNCGSDSHEGHRRHGKSKANHSGDCGAQSSFIQKKFSGLDVSMSTPPTAAVPLAPSALFLSSGVLTLLGITLRGRVPCNEA